MANRTEPSSELSVELAIARFKQGQCPSCGKGLGESRGLEYRPKTEDLYCHTCKRAWPSQMDVSYLEEQLHHLSTQQSIDRVPTVSEEPPPQPLVVTEAAADHQAVAPLVRLVSGVAALFSSVLKRH